MKKTTLLVALALTGLIAIQTKNLSAQIPLTETDFPQIGNIFVVANDSAPAVSPLPMGGNVSWNYGSFNCFHN